MKTLEKISGWAGKYMAIIALLVAIIALVFPDPVKGVIKTSYVNTLLGIVMFGMGMTLKLSDFKVVFTKPKAVITGILSQFIIEAVVLSTVGGALGVVLGIVVANAIGEINHWPIMIEISSAVYSFRFSAFVGMFFGFYPAYRASKLNPIDCLRYE